MFRGLWMASLTFCTVLPLLAEDSRPVLAQAADAAREQTPDPAVDLTEAEQAFVDQLTGCVLVGTFSFDGRDDQPPRTERYAISKVAKLKENRWVVEARITYGEIDVPVPVPVHVDWAGDTPVLSLTDLAIPLLGSGFTSRVMFYGDRYAGTWQHGEVGGHMWGKIEKPKANSGQGTANENGEPNER